MRSKIEWLAWIFGLFLVLIVILADLGIIPAVITWLYAFPWGDKLGHFLLMGIFSLLVNMSVNTCFRSALATGIIMAVTLLEEISQAMISSRHADWGDLAASFTGILLAALLVILLIKKYNIRRKAI